MKIRVTIVAAMTLFICVFALAQTKTNPLVEQYCSTCHTTERVYAAKMSRQGWDRTVRRMIDHGLKITPQAEAQIKAFLYTLQ